jgi:hypothetical protein
MWSFMTGHFDYVIVGGGIFGCYAALHLAKKGAKVCILEKENRLFQKASLVNQARLHSGYHYPRSIATAALSDTHKARFTEEHRDFVHFSFEKYYAIDRFGSFTDPLQFERFCTYLDIRCERVPQHPLFNFERIECLYRTEEYTFDPVLLREYYTRRVEQHAAITVGKNARIIRAATAGNAWQMEVQVMPANESPSCFLLQSGTVINATYSAINAINLLFGLSPLELTHEISEMAYVDAPVFRDKGLTVMDGPFGSIMPYGKSGLLSLSSVAYTHHKISYEQLPSFDCQTPDDASCQPQAPGICTSCVRRPDSNAPKMIRQMERYFDESVRFTHLFSYFTIKTKLKANYIDDGRPTEISKLHSQPDFFCLFSGKINSIYEIENIVN